MLHCQRLLVFPLVCDLGGKLSSWKELLYEGYPKHWKGFICFESWLSGWNHIWFSISSSPVNRGSSSYFLFFFKLYLFVLWQFKSTRKALVTSKSKYQETSQLFYFYGRIVILWGNAPSMHCSELLIILRLVLEVAKCETLGRPKWGH